MNLLCLESSKAKSSVSHVRIVAEAQMERLPYLPGDGILEQ